MYSNEDRDVRLEVTRQRLIAAAFVRRIALIWIKVEGTFNHVRQAKAVLTGSAFCHYLSPFAD
ncbi:hypothetical protein [Bacillus sp. JCM 19041]|uniref:hypothetical protein n=1 Tax=Bacillus sp. JCM 19041 TaxID=1460637 RepID=UPI000AFA2AB6